MTAVPKTIGQVEREINQRMRSLYKKKLGHKVSDVSCQLFDAKLAIVLEDAVTEVEKRLLESGRVELIEQVHEDLSDSIESNVKEIVESILNVNVIDILDDTKLVSGTTGIIAILSDAPQLRPSNNRKANSESYRRKQHSKQTSVTK